MSYRLSLKGPQEVGKEAQADPARLPAGKYPFDPSILQSFQAELVFGRPSRGITCGRDKTFGVPPKLVDITQRDPTCVYNGTTRPETDAGRSTTLSHRPATTHLTDH
jgi:hypothetical protein